MSKKAVIYARYSCSGQQEQSIETQIRVCKTFCVAKNYEHIQTYIDRGKTGRNFNRPGIQALLNDAKQQKFEIVVVYQLDRFARNVSESFYFEDLLKQSGVKLLSATELVTSENDDENDDLFLSRGIVTLFADNFSRDLSKKVKRGMRESYYQRISAGGNIPFGYKSIDKKIVIDENDAKVVRKAFELRAEGKSINEIMKILAKEQLTRSDGRIITASVLYTMFKNSKYTGKFTNPFDASDTITDMYPQIIDSELYLCVNSLNSQRIYRNNRSKSENYILINRLFDADSGNPYRCYCGTSSNGNLYRYYRYGSNKLPKEKFEQNVYEAVCEFMKEPNRRKKIAHLMSIHFQADHDKDNLRFLTNKLKQLELRQDKITEKYIACDKSVEDLLIAKARENKKKIDEIKYQIETEKRSMEKIQLSESEIENLICRVFKQRSEQDKTIEKILDQTINSIYISQDSFVIYLRLDNDLFVDHKQFLDDMDKIKTNQLLCVSTKVRLKFVLVAQGRIELPTQGFSVLCSAN